MSGKSLCPMNLNLAVQEIDSKNDQVVCENKNFCIDDVIQSSRQTP